MSKTNTPRDNNKPIRRSVILKGLEDPGVENGYYRQRGPRSKVCVEDRDGDRTQLDIDLKDSRAWLENLCKEEIRANLRDDEQERGKPASICPTKDFGMNTAILERIRGGERSRDTVFEDLLAPLRLKDSPAKPDESYSDMEQVLLAWNKRINSNQNSDLEAYKCFIAALEGRLQMDEKVLAIVNDPKNLDRYNRVGQEGILEPSRRRLLQAIHAYRPETRNFENQDPFRMLVIMWAHLREERGDDDKEWMYLTYKTLNAETALANRFEHIKKKQKFEELQEMAIRDGDERDVERCRQAWQNYNRKKAGQARQRILAQILHVRSELKKLELNDVLELSILQSSQKQVFKNSHSSNDTGPHWTELEEKCAEVDIHLEDRTASQFPELDAMAELSFNQVEAMMMIYDTAMTRALKLTGKDLKAVDEEEKERIIGARLEDVVVTAMMQGETLNGVLEVQKIAGQILRDVELMEVELAGLSLVAKKKCEVYGDWMRLVDEG
jgi:hypothetical protein